MQLINKERQTGKTTGLIYTSEATGYPIIVRSLRSKQLISEMAKKLGCTIPEPMTISEYSDMRRAGGISYTNVLVDEIETILGDAVDEYIHGHVVAATISLPMSTIQKEDAK